jgi:transposase
MAWRRGQAYGPDLRARVLAALDAGATVREAAARFAVSPSYCAKVRLRRGATGEVEARPQRGGHRPRLLAPHEAALRARLDEDRDATLAGLRAWLRREHGVSASIGTVWASLARMGLTHKKKRFRAAEQDRPDVAEARAAWAGMMPGLDPARLVFLDETWASTRMARTNGWAPRGERLVAAVPHGRWRVTTFVGALRPQGFTAPAVIDGAMDGPTFLAYVRQFLAPTLATGDVLVLDNLNVHKVAGVREAIEARGATLLYLPPYSPDLNPIELAFSKLKRLLRSAAERTAEGLWTTIGALLGRFGPDECAAYFRHCGYAQSP